MQLGAEGFAAHISLLTLSIFILVPNYMVGSRVVPHGWVADLSGRVRDYDRVHACSPVSTESFSKTKARRVSSSLIKLLD
jgi:hypothetical protein